MDRNETISAFLGLNKRDVVGNGELAATRNCSPRRYPLLAPRQPREYISSLVPPISSCVVNNALYFSTHNYNGGTDWVTLYRYLPGEYHIEFDVSMYGGAWYLYDSDNNQITTGTYGIDFSPALYLVGIGVLGVTKAEYGFAVQNRTRVGIGPTEYTWIQFDGEVEWTFNNGYPGKTVMKFTSEDQSAYSAERIRLTCTVAEEIAIWTSANDNLHDGYSPYHGATTMVGMGANVFIFPEGYYYNTATDEYGSIFESAMGGSVFGYWELFPCDVEGRAMTAVISGTEPEPTSYPAYWVDTSAAPNKLWVNEGEGWAELAAGYCCIRYTYPGAPSPYINSTGLRKFSVDDSIDIISLTDNRYGVNTIPESNVVLRTYLDSANNVEAILVNGTVVSSDTQSGGRIDRNLPELDYVCECENRLWGVKKDENEIHACALGNFLAWSRYEGTSMDSWTASRGCPGIWTGCINYLGTPTFFKENYIECVYPASSGAHQTSTLHINGTGPISPKSIAMVDNIVYYLGTTGFYAYSGSLPKKISQALAENYYTDGVAGDLSGFYYVSCKDKDLASHLFVYDTENRLWYEEDGTEAVGMARMGSKLYIFGDELMFCTSGGDEKVKWMAITGDMVYNSYEDRYPREIDIRFSGFAEDHISVEIEYDGSGSWERVCTLSCKGEHRYENYPIIPARCDHYRLRFIGEGDSAIWNINTVYHDGGKTK